MGRTAAGRMINQDIALSAKVASLSPEALALFCLLIPHFTGHGKMLANPYAIKGNVCPLTPWLTVEKIEECLTEISQKTNVRWWRDVKGLCYLQSLNWHEHQDLRADRLGTDRLPDYPGDDQLKLSLTENSPGVPDSPGSSSAVVPDNSGSTLGVLPHEVEVEVEVEKKDEGKKNPSSDALRLSGFLADLIADNNPNNRTIQHKQRDKSIRRWAGDIDRMLQLDHRSPSDVDDVIRWCQADSFWSSNILSGAKLREQFDQLMPQMRRDDEKTGRCGSVGNIEDSGRRIY